MCQNVGTLFLCDVVLWMATDPEMGEYKVSKSYSWPGPSPRSTIRDKRQPRVININLINIMVSYWRKYLYIKGRERGLARWVLNFHPNTKRGRVGRWGKKLFLSYVLKSSRTVFYLCWEAEAGSPATSLWCTFHIPLSLGNNPQKHHIGSKFPYCDIGWILQM